VDPAVIAVAFGAIFLVELPDKTFVAALVLSTRYRPFAVWVGVGLAFLVQTAIACTVGGLVTLLPHRLVEVVAAVIFLGGAILLLREAPKADAGEAETEEEFAAKATSPKSGLAAVGASFLVLFAAEWGDLSQLLTISLVGRYHAAWPVSRAASCCGTCGSRRSTMSARACASCWPSSRRTRSSRGDLPGAAALGCAPCRLTLPPTGQAVRPTLPTRRWAASGR
jgi:putative Ca2+/H+ antiporter (TMEM165/GDT1 family)